MSTQFSASVICMDPINLESYIGLTDVLGIRFLHIDIMDGNNVPRYGLYPEQLMRINDISDTKLDVHLMVKNVEFTLDQLKNVKNIENLIFHIEGNEGNLLRIIDAGKNISKHIGVAVNMTTSPDIVKNLIYHALIDSITFMAIHPGVLKQTSRPELLYSSMVNMLTTDNSNLLKYISVDGGVSFDTIIALCDSGANLLVGGSGTIFKGVNFKTNFGKQQSIVQSNWNAIKRYLTL